MTTLGPAFLSALGVISALGRGKRDVLDNLIAAKSPGVVQRRDLLIDGSAIYVGEVGGDLPPLPASLSIYASRNTQLIVAAVDEIRAEIDAAIDRFGAGRIAVVMGASTSGIAEGEEALRKAVVSGELPPDFDMRKQELGSVGEVVARYLSLGGPAYTISTACSSGAQALAAGRRLLAAGVADVVLAGGVDSLCRMTVNGFQALSALSSGVCNPFSRNRDGTMIGEGAAVFLMQREEAAIALLGAGTTSDAYSMTAPEPDGHGLIQATQDALSDAGLTPSMIDYIHLHGTGTLQNDEVESRAVKQIFGSEVPCSSSKAQLGHTLGAAGAMGAAHCWLALSDLNIPRLLPPHVWDGAMDDDLLAGSLVTPGQKREPAAAGIFLSNAIAFGGNNVSLIIART